MQRGRAHRAAGPIAPPGFAWRAISARRGWNIETSSQVSVGFGPASPATAPKATKCDGSVIKTVPLWLRKCRRQAPVEGLREIWRSADDKRSEEHTSELQSLMR